MNRTRSEARVAILGAANGKRARNRMVAQSPLGMNRIQEAVCIVRRNRLVRDSVLTAAGYRTVDRRSGRRGCR